MKNRVSLDDPNYNYNNQDNNKSSRIIILALFAMFALAAILTVVFKTGNNYYYVAKLPNYNAATVQVDGYLHKSKSCCQKVADSFDAEVIKVNLKDVAGYTEYGQEVTYEKAFRPCPYCYN